MCWMLFAKIVIHLIQKKEKNLEIKELITKIILF